MMYIVELDTLERYGLRVESWGKGWTLLELESGANLQIEGIGEVVPRKRDAIAEGLRRIDDGQYGEDGHASR